MKFVVVAERRIAQNDPMGRYGSYCPVSLATETLGERWTILIVLALIDGVSRFAEMQRALPRISPAVLTSRLRSLEEAGVLNKKRRQTGGYEYALTQAGRDLEPIVMELAYWGQRWARDMEPDDLDPRSLAWSMHTRMNTDAMPSGRTVIEFDFPDGPNGPAVFWIINTDGVVDVCAKHPGYEPDVRVVSELRRFVEVWRGFRPLRAELTAGRIQLTGARALTRAFPNWLLLSAASHVGRERPGRERSVSRRFQRT
jgi:DNA-binding HxlR family transcriptional regulator